MKSIYSYVVKTTSHQDYKYAQQISDEMALSAQKRGVAVAQRPKELIKEKMKKGLAVIAINNDTGEWMGFCYLEVWQHEKMVANSGLIIAEAYRGLGISKEIKLKMFELSRERYPGAIILSLSTSPAVIHVNHHLGFTTISHQRVMKNEWVCNGSNSWVNYTDLMKNNHGNLPYTAMVYIPDIVNNNKPIIKRLKNLKQKIRLFTNKKMKKVA